ncbi:MAG: glycosyltransferase family 4 protein [Deltaproteobacteria bacterium]|nr:glycosyltransferase family 4 protein [Deltaproteobacteria bacterium]
MKILVLLPDSPDPWSNTAARYYGPVLKALAELGHDLTVLAVRRPGADGLEYFGHTTIHFRFLDQPEAKPFVERKLRSLWRGGWELAASEFGRAARQEAARDYDVILAEEPAAARALENDPRTVLSLLCLRYVDLEVGEGDEADIGWREQLQARRAELSTCRRVPVIRVVSERLERLLRNESVGGLIRVIPLCIDPALYDWQPAPAVPTVGVLGSMFWPPSRRAARHFLEHLVPRIRAAQPGVRFVVGGWQAEHYLRHLVRDSDVEILDSFRSPAGAFSRLSVLVYAPPVGTGMKVKVLEAMAYGVPAVVNSEGFEGLEADPDPPVRLANSDDEIVEQVSELLQDPAARRRAAEEGRRCVDRSFCPEAVARALIGLFHERDDGRVGRHARGVAGLGERSGDRVVLPLHRQ